MVHFHPHYPHHPHLHQLHQLKVRLMKREVKVELVKKEGEISPSCRSTNMMVNVMLIII